MNCNLLMALRQKQCGAADKTDSTAFQPPSMGLKADAKVIARAAVDSILVGYAEKFVHCKSSSGLVSAPVLEGVFALKKEHLTLTSRLCRKSDQLRGSDQFCCFRARAQHRYFCHCRVDPRSQYSQCSQLWRRSNRGWRIIRFGQAIMRCARREPSNSILPLEGCPWCARPVRSGVILRPET